MTLFEIEGLRKIYGDRTVLDIPELVLKRGTIYALLGPNGAGKTTLLEILSLVLPPTGGRVRYSGKGIHSGGNHPPALRREIVMVQQNPVLFTTTVRKNLEFGLKIRHVAKEERERIIAESLDLVGMGPFAKAYAHKLSAGETQRVAIARALACFPEVILLDEPFGSVDVENRILIEEIIQDINRARGISVIFTTHDRIQASRLAEESLFLFEGRIGRSVYENIFSAVIEAKGDGRKYCLLPKGVRLYVDCEKTGPVRISIDPEKVALGKWDERPSSENAFKGTLIQVMDEHGVVRALVDVGLPISVLVPKTVFRELGVGMGEDVWLICPKAGIDIL